MNKPIYPQASKSSGILLVIGIVVAIAVSCQKEFTNPRSTSLELPSVEYNYSLMDLPAHIPQFRSWRADSNTVTNAGATLGRVLFYDKSLSITGRKSCASCHIQSLAFADKGQFSEGFKSEFTKRNSPPIQNLQSRRAGFFMDSRAGTIEQQVLMPVQDHVEMGFRDTNALSDRITKIPYYASLFENAFGSEQVTPQRISFALAQFIKSMWSYRSKYDEGLETEFANFSPLEKRGRELFNGKARCGSCHSDGNLDGYSANIGLDMEYEDKGWGATDDHNQSTTQDGVFNVLSLRNVALTAPYMHDGRFETLDEVVEFYNSGIQAHANLDYRLREFPFDNSDFPIFLPFPFDNGPVKPIQLNLETHEKKALIAYMHTFTDTEFIRDERFSNPFRVAEQ